MTSDRTNRTGWRETETAFGVYVHWPFCLAKCPYCDFNSHVRRNVGHGGADDDQFTAALRDELAHMAQLAPGRRVDTVFFGGGTPSLMPPETVAAVLDEIAGRWSLASDAEITLEANPTSVEAQRFAGYRDAGVNRVSVGIQAFNDHDLRLLGRRHTVAEALEARTIARATFERVSFDLIYARSGQTLGDWRTELARALAFEPDHLSLYQLTIEPGTAYAALDAAGKLDLPDEDLAAAFFETTGDLCDAAGLPAYEVSNHAAPGAQSRHNLIYWRYGEYAGIGPGAHGRLVVDGTRRALTTIADPQAWQRAVAERGHAIVEDTALTPREQADEIIVMGLRLREGLPLARFARAGVPAPDRRVIDDLVGQGLIAPLRADKRLRATPAGRPLINAIATELARETA